MTNGILDQNQIEYINKELNRIHADKEELIQEKNRIRDYFYSQPHNESNIRMLLLKKYDEELEEQYNLLCRRDFALMRLIATIGEILHEQEQGCKYNQAI